MRSPRRPARRPAAGSPAPPNPARTWSGPSRRSRDRRPVAASSACRPGSGFRSTWASTTASAGTRRRPAVQHLEGGAAVLQVHHHRRAGRRVRRADRLDHPAFEGADRPVVDARLQHARPDRCSGRRRPPAAPAADRRTRGMPSTQVARRTVRRARRRRARSASGRGRSAPPGARRWWRRSAGRCRRLIRASAAGRRPSPVGVASTIASNAGPDQQAGLGATGRLVVELVTGQQRADLEQMLVVVDPAELLRGDVAVTVRTRAGLGVAGSGHAGSIALATTMPTSAGSGSRSCSTARTASDGAGAHPVDRLDGLRRGVRGERDPVGEVVGQQGTLGSPAPRIRSTGCRRHRQPPGRRAGPRPARPRRPDRRARC